MCATIGVAIAIYVSSSYGGFDVALEQLSAEIAPLVEELMSPKIQLPTGVDVHSLARAMVLAAAPVVAASSLVMLMLNLWLAGGWPSFRGSFPARGPISHGNCGCHGSIFWFSAPPPRSAPISAASLASSSLLSR